MENVDFDSKDRPLWLQPPGKCLVCSRPLFRKFVCDACYEDFKGEMKPNYAVGKEIKKN